MTDEQITEIFMVRVRLAEPGSEFDHVGFARDIARLARMDDMYIRMGKVAMRFIDRANDVSPDTGKSAERILAEWAAATNEEIK